MNELTSNTTRDFIEEAQAIGSKAQTRKGALKALIRHHHDYPEFYRRNPRPMSKWAWESQQEARKSNPIIKRAQADKIFRKKYLAALKREEKRLVAKPGDVESAYVRLREIVQERKQIIGKANMPARSWMTKNEQVRYITTLAQSAGLEDDWDGESFCEDRGDHFCITVEEVSNDPRFLAAGKGIVGLVRHDRRRIYAKSSDFRMSNRSDYYIVGENENGQPFAHQVTNKVGEDVYPLLAAWEWIWNRAEIIARQGDIGIAPSTLKKAEGETLEIRVGGGHSRHVFIGEVYQNGSTHIKSGFLIHEGEQHPPVYLDGSCWRRVVIARRSDRGMSTRD